MLRQGIAEAQRYFYGGLRIRRLLQADRVKRIMTGDVLFSNGVRVGERTAWHILLEDLCLLCDFRSGGSTTTAIAVEERDIHTIFWVVSDLSRREVLQSHLWQMLQLVKMAACDVERRDECGDLLFERAVQRSAGRIHNCVGRLWSAYQHIPAEADGEGDG